MKVEQETPTDSTLNSLLEEWHFLRLCSAGRTNIYGTTVLPSRLVPSSGRPLATFTSAPTGTVDTAYAPSSRSSSPPYPLKNSIHSHIPYSETFQAAEENDRSSSNGDTDSTVNVRWLPRAHGSTWLLYPEDRKTETNATRERHHLVVATSTGWTALISEDGSWGAIEMVPAAGFGEILSIHGYDRSETGTLKDGPVLAIATFQAGATPATTPHASPVVSPLSEPFRDKYELRIYGGATSSDAFDKALFQMNGDCQVLPLSSATTVITHATITINGVGHSAFVVCGMDAETRIFYQHPDSENRFVEIPCEDHFPMLSTLAKAKRQICSLVIVQLGECRITVAGCQDGTLHVAIAESDGTGTHDIGHQRIHSTALFTPLTSVTVFNPYTPGGSNLRKYVTAKNINLLVTGAAEFALVYSSIERNGLTSMQFLPRSGDFDTVLCSHVADITYDGTCAIFLGTYGNQLLMYKQDVELSTPGCPIYRYAGRREFAYPIYNIQTLDLNGDGMLEMVVVSMYGIHVLQSCVKKAREKCIAAFKTLRDIRELQRRLESLQTAGQGVDATGKSGEEGEKRDGEAREEKKGEEG